MMLPKYLIKTSRPFEDYTKHSACLGALGDQDEVVAELRLDGAVDDADLLIEDHGVELLHHLAAAKLPEVPPALARGAGRVSLGRIGKGGLARGDLGLKVLGLGLGLDEDVGGLCLARGLGHGGEGDEADEKEGEVGLLHVERAAQRSWRCQSWLEGNRMRMSRFIPSHPLGPRHEDDMRIPDPPLWAVQPIALSLPPGALSRRFRGLRAQLMRDRATLDLPTSRQHALRSTPPQRDRDSMPNERPSLPLR
mmetsp:Transcript_29174/g.93189  ORF Transcript_29174/g.93189 Transcript_29174/m.93189 type:complete len:251 (-) Transcript_29174:309-1061(-)